MIGNKLEQSIIEVFQNDLFSTFSINQISKILNKSYPLINKKSNFFLKEGILKKLDIGKSYQCFLNMESDKALILMTLNEIHKKEQFLARNTEKELSQEPRQLSSKFPIESIILYKKTLIFVCSDKFNRESLKQHSLLTDKYTFIFMDKERLKSFFLENKDFRDYHLILFNPHRFIEIISELKDKIILSAYNGQADESVNNHENHNIQKNKENRYKS